MHCQLSIPCSQTCGWTQPSGEQGPFCTLYSGCKDILDPGIACNQVFHQISGLQGYLMVAQYASVVFFKACFESCSLRCVRPSWGVNTD